MKKLSFFTSLVLLASFASCSESAETSTIESQESTTIATSTTADITTTLVPDPIMFDVFSSELDKPISGTYRNPAFSMKISSLWNSKSEFDYGFEIVPGLYFRINTAQSNNYTDNSDFIKKYLDTESKWQLYKNKNEVEFACINESVNNTYEMERSVFKFYNNGILFTVFIGTKSADGITLLSPISVDNIIDTIELIESESKTESTTQTPTASQLNPNSFSGNGDSVTNTFTANGCTRIKGEYTGERYFHVTLYDSEGNYESLVFSNLGQYTGEKVFKFENDKQYMFEVSAKDGDWKISVE